MKTGEHDVIAHIHAVLDKLLGHAKTEVADVKTDIVDDVKKDVAVDAAKVVAEVDKV